MVTVGVTAIALGCKGFTPGGIPWTKRQNITGGWAEIIGTLCMILGAAFLCLALYGLSVTR